MVKRKGFNLIDTSATGPPSDTVEAERAKLAVQSLQAAIEGRHLDGPVEPGSHPWSASLEGSVLTAIALVMIVVLAALGTRPALLVGFAIPDVLPVVFRPAGGDGNHNLQHRDVRPDPCCGDAG